MWHIFLLLLITIICMYSTYWDHPSPSRMHIMYIVHAWYQSIYVGNLYINGYISYIHTYVVCTYICTTYSRLPNYSSHPKNHSCWKFEFMNNWRLLWASLDLDKESWIRLLIRHFFFSYFFLRWFDWLGVLISEAIIQSQIIQSPKSYKA